MLIISLHDDQYPVTSDYVVDIVDIDGMIVDGLLIQAHFNDMLMIWAANSAPNELLTQLHAPEI